MNPTAAKPVRVESTTVKVFDCPVCGREVLGEVQVAIHLGAMNLENVIEEDGERVSVSARVSTRTELRGLTVRHQCTGQDKAVEEG